MKFPLVLIPLLAVTAVVIVSGQENDNENLCRGDNRVEIEIPEWYSKHHPPMPGGNKPVTVNFMFYLEAISEVDDLKGEILISLLVFISWNDSRISLNGSCGGFAPTESLAQIWKPDLYFVNAQRVPVSGGYESEPPEILQVLPDNTLQWVFKTKQIVDCNMNFDQYPFDDHYCRVLLCSLKDNTRVQKYETVGGVIIEPAVHMEKIHQYYMEFLPLGETDKQVWVFGDKYPRSLAGFKIKLERRIIPIMINTFMTTVMIVIISIISFRIPPESVPGRMGLLVTSFLVLVNISNEANDEINGSTSFTALDFWLISCKAFVAFGIFEYAVLLRIMRQNEPSDNNEKLNSVGVDKRSRMRIKKEKKRTKEEICARIDGYCLMGSFIGFGAFTIAYSVYSFFTRMKD